MVTIPDPKRIPDIPNPYGYVYITTNLKTDQFYVGQHKSTQFDPHYYGSGVNLKADMLKYPRMYFKCEPIEWCKTAEELDKAEQKWITDLNAINDPNWYNTARQSDSCYCGWKINLNEFLEILEALNVPQINVIVHLLSNLDSHNFYIGSQRKISKNIGVSHATVSKIMGKLQELGLIKQIQWGVYQVSPRILMRGSEQKRQVLLSYFDESKSRPKKELVKRTPIIRLPNGEYELMMFPDASEFEMEVVEEK